MKDKLNTTINWIIRNKKKTAVAVVVFIFLLYKLLGSGSANTTSTIIAEKKDIVDSISVTGKVTSSQNVSMSFEKTGKLARVNVPVGTRVRAGTILASLSNSDLIARVLSARADRDSQAATLAELKRGTREEELNIKILESKNAETSEIEARKAFVNALLEAYTKADDAIRNKADQFFSNPRSQSPNLSFAPVDSIYKNDLETRRPIIEKTLTDWYLRTPDINIASNLEAESSSVESSLYQIRAFLDELSLAVNSTTVSGSISKTTIDAWKLDVLTARTNVNTAISSIQSARETAHSAESAANVAREKLSLAQNGSTIEDVNAAEAKLKSLEAQVLAAEAELEKTIIRAPFDGLVTKQDGKVGEIVSANKDIVGLISDDNFEIETFIPEVEVAHLSLGNPAVVTLDALGSDTEFGASVVSVEPAETVVDGVSTYKTILDFTNPDPRIRSGMTANIIITLRSASSSIAVPVGAIHLKNARTYATLLKNKTKVEVPVLLGIEGGGMVEIKSGIKEGDVVVVSQ